MNSLAAAAAGLFIGYALALMGSEAGFLIAFLGVQLGGLGGAALGMIIDGLREKFHDPMLRLFGKPDYERILSNEAKRFRLRDIAHSEFTLHSLQVKDRAATVKCELHSPDAEKEIRSTLLRVRGIDRVVVELSERN